ncbi:aryl-alcohol dehydrogenase-like predicted oxidoreductase [Brevibacterium sanguinis]|uniref:Aryl-alcohol dehydrogenase-like predicted oxidoreductase n=2 Tax=Brevibacterium TaxID=1696 RepID=A0A366IQM4_9MICO|nr:MULTISPECIES: aldo/keto reductase [Brevibacterium]RBP68166.1 aryl-alcohol dehydrogenase-like predicted oxidoreductase [Brevibacterium sanguinis]RBP74417.1 aryl-alcohol dehydrogenase-like predicted oxidoreductase [Brevibacterium celere]
MTRVQLADTRLMVHPLQLGGNPFGWGADKEQSFAVLDAYAEAGGNFIDTADVYSVWVPGNSGGESETIIGEWMKARGNRDDMVIATKVGMHPKHAGLDPANIRECIDASLRRLGTDHIDLYYAHIDDEEVDQLAVAETFDALVRSGKVRYLGASNFGLERLRSALKICEKYSLACYRVVQDEYNLVSRSAVDRQKQTFLRAEGIAELPFHSLASGFLTGKHTGGDAADSVRGDRVADLLENQDALGALEVLHDVASAHGASMTATAIAWQLSHDFIPATIASARVPEQLTELLAGTELVLTEAEISALEDCWAEA